MTTTVTVKAGHKGATVIVESYEGDTNDARVEHTARSTHHLKPDREGSYTVTDGMELFVREPKA